MRFLHVARSCAWWAPVVVSCRTTSVCRRPSAYLVVPGGSDLPPPQTTPSLTFCCPACGICDQIALACDAWLCPRWCVDDWVVFWWIRWFGSPAIWYEAVFCSNASRTLPVSFHLLSSASMYLPHTVVLKRHMLNFLFYSDVGVIPDHFQVWVHSCRLLDSVFDFYWTVVVPGQCATEVYKWWHVLYRHVIDG